MITIRDLKKLLAVGLVAMGGFAMVQADDGRKPNILFIVSDDLNTDLGAYGHPLVQSPNIDRLADKGIRFDAAYNQYPGCNPSRTSFLSGLYPEQVGMTLNGSHSYRDMAPDVVTLPRHFRQNGYFTGRVGKVFHYGVPGDIGTDGKDDPNAWDQVANPSGIDRQVEDRVKSLYAKGKEPSYVHLGGTLTWLSLDSEDAEHTDGMVAREAVRMLEANHPDKTGMPFFLGVGFFRPHTPFIAPKKYFDLYPLDKIEPVKNPENDRDDIPEAALPDRPGQLAMTDRKKKEAIQAYYASITFMDAQLGYVLDALERLNLAGNTIVVFLSDHGYQLGHHGLWQKGDLFEGSARTPLIVYDPRARANGSATRSLVELIDLYPTLTGLAGLDVPAHVSGKSFAPLLENPAATMRHAAFTQAISRAPAVTRSNRNIMGYSIRTDRYRYTQWGDGQSGEELYDYEADPGEFSNKANQHSYFSVKIKLQYLLAQRKAQAAALKSEVKLDIVNIGEPAGFGK